MTTIDVTWSEVTSFILVWPLDMPDRPTVVTACREVLGTSRHHVIAAAGDDADALLTEAIGAAAVVSDGSADYVVLHSPHGLAVAHSHIRGDGVFTADLRDRLMAAMGVGAPPAVRMDRPLSLLRCGAALLEHWARDPRRPVRALRFLKVRRASARPAARGDRSTAADAVDPRTTLIVVPAEEIAGMRAALADLGVQASASMALLYAIWSAHAGSEQAPGQLQVMVGLRRYSRLIGNVRGNMVGRLVITVPPGTPEGLAELGAAARSWIDSAEPLLLHAAKISAVRLRALAASVRRRPSPHWESSWREGGVDVTWSDCGASSAMVETTVAWSPDHPAAQRQVIMAARPVGPSLAVNVHWVGTAAHLALTYDASKIDIDPVLAVLGDSPARYLRSMAPNHPEVT